MCHFAGRGVVLVGATELPKPEPERLDSKETNDEDEGEDGAADGAAATPNENENGGDAEPEGDAEPRGRRRTRGTTPNPRTRKKPARARARARARVRATRTRLDSRLECACTAYPRAESVDDRPVVASASRVPLSWSVPPESRARVEEFQDFSPSGKRFGTIRSRRRRSVRSARTSRRTPRPSSSRRWIAWRNASRGSPARGAARRRDAPGWRDASRISKNGWRDARSPKEAHPRPRRESSRRFDGRRSVDDAGARVEASREGTRGVERRGVERRSITRTRLDRLDASIPIFSRTIERVLLAKPRTATRAKHRISVETVSSVGAPSYANAADGLRGSHGHVGGARRRSSKSS